MKVASLAPQPENPRTITPAKAAQLKKTLLEFGDISGVVFNVKTKHLVGGHRRVENFDQGASVVYTKKYKKPTKTGTVAEGHILLKGEKFSYREVNWPLAREKAANLAANKNAGEWDLPQVGKWIKELGSFDVDIDLDLTGFDPTEIAELPALTEVSGHERKTGGAGDDEDEEEAPRKFRCKRGELYELGTSQLRVGPDEVEFCDKMITRFEKWSGQEAVLLESAKKKKPAEQGKSRDEILGRASH